MTTRVILPRKSISEDLEVLFGFQDQMPFGTTISGTDITVIVASGVDPNPTAILDGSPSLVDTYFIKQNLTGGVGGVTYLLTCSVAVSGGLLLSRQAYLAVLDPAEEF